MVSGAIGVAVLTTFLTQQTTTHARDIAAGLTTRPLGTVAATCVQQAGSQVQALQTCIGQHALTMGLNDTFLFTLFGCILCTILSLFLGRDPALEAAKAAKLRGETLEVERPVAALSE